MVIEMLPSTRGDFAVTMENGDAVPFNMNCPVESVTVGALWPLATVNVATVVPTAAVSTMSQAPVVGSGVTHVAVIVTPGVTVIVIVFVSAKAACESRSVEKRTAVKILIKIIFLLRC